MWSMVLRGTGMDALSVVDRPRPETGAGEVLVRVKAASINYRDLALIRGDYGAAPREALVPLSDGAGEVVEVGEGVTRFRAGDRVIFAMRPEWHDGRPSRKAITTSLGMTLDGVLTEYRVATEDALVRTPAHLTDEQAASLPIAAVTAWTALANGNLQAGETVVVQGTGGVSLFALQFAHHHGAKTILLSSSDAKLERARALGIVDHAINYSRMPEWPAEVAALTGGEGAEHVLDIGGAATLDRSLDAVRPGGNIYLIGFLGGLRPELDLEKVFRRAAVLRGLSVGSVAAFRDMNAFIERHAIVPVVDRVFGREELVAALQYMEAGALFGKVALRVA